MDETQNEGLYLLNELLRNGYTQETLPLPQGKLSGIEDGDEFTAQDLVQLRHAYNNNNEQHGGESQAL